MHVYSGEDHINAPRIQETSRVWDKSKNTVRMECNKFAKDKTAVNSYQEACIHAIKENLPIS